jgi:osmotically-inducible protein OsmY
MATPLNYPGVEVPMRLIRVLFGIFLLAGVCFLLLGYWAGSSFGRIERPSDAVGTAGDIDTQKARERGAELGEKAAVATANARDAARDASVTGKIVAKMALDDVVKARTIDVDSDGSTVTLTGRVRSAAERDRAVALARETEGVTRVVDRLRIEP